MEIEFRCFDCRAEAEQAIADAAWIIAAGGDPWSHAVAHDMTLAAVWVDIAEWHGEGEQ